MFSRRYTLIVTLALCCSAAIGITVLSMLDKEGGIVTQIPGHVFVLASPFIGIAAGAA